MTNKAFLQQLQHYRQLTNDDIAAYSRYLQATSDVQFGQSSTSVTAAFAQLLNGPANRLRGMLTIVGYEMSGGTNQPMIIQAARVMEMLHAALLIFDDIQDNAPTRRGQPAAHVQLGVNLAINAGLLGSFAAEMILANLDVAPELRANAVSITNRTLVTTIHGQNADQMGDPEASLSPETIALWKTANYTTLNPLHVGMVLAGADCNATDAITPYALELGQGFQIINDVDGVFGDSNGGEASMGDIREGKRTLLTEYALSHAAQVDKAFLQTALGNPKLTRADFLRVQKVLRDCGALERAQQLAGKHAQKAVSSLRAAEPYATADTIEFLRQTANYLVRLPS